MLIERVREGVIMMIVAAVWLALAWTPSPSPQPAPRVTAHAVIPAGGAARSPRTPTATPGTPATLWPYLAVIQRHEL